MKIIICKATLRDVLRFTALARATDDVIDRADFYRFAERCREQMKETSLLR